LLLLLLQLVDSLPAEQQEVSRIVDQNQKLTEYATTVPKA
jgi:hypothetical protein